jgi:mono/diheme cytochrome c family protein
MIKKQMILAATSALMLISCTSKVFDTPQKLGGQWVSAETLNVGHDTYMNYCMQCHGVEGDGRGPAAQGSMPLPRNFKLGIFKFGSVSTGELPTDEDLKRTIRYGLRGTPMLPWDISEKRLNAVVQYIKTFSPRWKEEAPGTPVALSKDPWGPELASQAIEQGKKIYHGFAQCHQCHPAYLTVEEISQYSKEISGNEVKEIRSNPHLSTLLDSSHEVKIMPPDFTKSSIKTYGSVETIYRVLGTGIGGTAMPAWKGLLSAKGDAEESEKNQWAVAYYVESLHRLKFDLEARKKFFTDLNLKRSQSNKQFENKGTATQ